MNEQGWRWRPLGVADLLDDMFKVFRGRFGLFFAVNAVILVPVALLQTAVLPITSLDAWEWYVGSSVGATIGQPLPELADGFSLVGYGFISTFITLLATSLLSGASIWLTVQHIHGGRPGLGDVLGAGLKHVWRIVGNSLLLALTFIGVALVLAIVVAFVVVFLGPLAGSILGVLLMIAGLIAAAIAIGARWMLAAPAIVAEDAGVGAAIGRSFRLARGAVWALTGRYLLFLIMVMLLTAVPGAVIAALAQVALDWGSPRLIAAVTGTGTAVLNAVFQPLLPIMLTLLYFDRRVRTEGYDLQQLTEQLEP